jgi:proteasome lid subunit RPN8/RPN11
MNLETKALIIEHAKKEFPRECCGLLLNISGYEVYFPCKNIAKNQIDFILDPADYARAEDAGEVIAVVHSHCNISPKPSQADLVSCERSKLPWHIVSIPNETWHSFHPNGYKAPLIGREFSHGVNDCYSLIRDFYKENLGIELPDFDRSEKWWDSGEDLYFENFKKAGFEITDELKTNDVILIQLKSPVINHGAVYLGNDVIIHHVMNRLSYRETYSGFWKKCTRFILRYKGLA